MRKRWIKIGFGVLVVLFAASLTLSLTKGRRVQERELVLACLQGDARTVHRLLKQGVDPNAVVRPDQGSDLEWWYHETVAPGDRSLFRVPALNAAASQASLAIVDDLLAHGANPNFVDATGYSALLDATHRGEADMVRHLLQHGANPRLTWKDGTRPMDEARSNEVKALLLSHGG